MAPSAPASKSGTPPVPASGKHPLVFERILTRDDIRPVSYEDDVMLVSRVDSTLLPLADHAEVIVTDERLGMQWAWRFKKRSGLRGRLDSSYLVSGVHNYLVTAGAVPGCRLHLEGRRSGPWLVSVEPSRR
jgi:hypothetical protein